MASRPAHVITTCQAANADCSSFGAGHNTHTIQATLAGRRPDGWRSAVVTEVDGQCVSLLFGDRAEAVVIWHHLPLDSALSVGSTVRLHVQHALLEVSKHWISVALSEIVDVETGDHLISCTES